jgi:hypothetical protein
MVIPVSDVDRIALACGRHQSRCCFARRVCSFRRRLRARQRRCSTSQRSWGAARDQASDNRATGTRPGLGSRRRRALAHANGGSCRGFNGRPDEGEQDTWHPLCRAWHCVCSWNPGGAGDPAPTVVDTWGWCCHRLQPRDGSGARCSGASFRGARAEDLLKGAHRAQSRWRRRCGNVAAFSFSPSPCRASPATSAANAGRSLWWC